MRLKDGEDGFLPVRRAMTNLLVFAVNNLLDRFTTQGSHAGNRSLIVLGLFLTASELGALNRQLRGLRLTAFVRDSSAKDQSSL